MGHEVDEADGGVHGGRIDGILLGGLEEGEVQAHIVDGCSDDGAPVPEFGSVVAGGMGIEDDFHLIFLDSVHAGEGQRHLSHSHDLSPEDDVGMLGVVDKDDPGSPKEGILEGLGHGGFHKRKERVVMKGLDGDPDRFSEAHLPGGGNLGESVQREEVVSAPRKSEQG